MLKKNDDKQVLKEKIDLLNKIDEAWKKKINLYGVKYDLDKGYFAYRNAIFNLLY